MSGRDPAALVAQLSQADPDACDRVALGELVHTAHQLRSWLDAFDVRLGRRAAQLATEGRSEAPDVVLGDRGRRKNRDAKAAASRSDVCDELPAFEDALAGGEIAAGHVDAIGRAARDLDGDARNRFIDHGDELLDLARHATVWEFERTCRQLTESLAADDGSAEHERLRRASKVTRWIDRTSGLFVTKVELDPERAASWWQAIDREAIEVRQRHAATGEDIALSQATVDALVGMSVARTSSPGRQVASVSVLIDLETLVGSLHERSVHETTCGATLPVSSIRRLCCDADIIPVVLGGDGEVLDVGRGQRLATPAQRTALAAMYRTCGHPSCSVGFVHCDVHHVDPWKPRGPTDLANLLPLCNEHHHQVHEGGWELTLHPDRTIALRRPDGTLFFQGTTVDRTRRAA